MQWIEFNKQKPINKQDVIVCFENSYKKRIVTIATYIAAKSVLAEDFLSEDGEGCQEYDEEKDCYWVIEGFFEWQYTADMQWFVSDEITHWMPKPVLPSNEPDSQSKSLPSVMEIETVITDYQYQGFSRNDLATAILHLIDTKQSNSMET